MFKSTLDTLLFTIYQILHIPLCAVDYCFQKGSSVDTLCNFHSSVGIYKIFFLDII